MSRNVNRDASSLILTIRLSDESDAPITSIPFDDVDLQVAWLNSSSSDWTVVTLFEGTVGEFVSNGWAEVGNGIYQYCLPNVAIAPGDRTQIRVTYASHPPLYDAIDAVIVDAVNIPNLADALADALAGTSLTINSPIFSGEDGQNLSLIQGDDYSNTPVRIDIESGEDLTALHFVIAARLQSNSSIKLGLRMQIQSDGAGQFAMFAPTAEQTESWSSGTYAIRYRIQYATNKFKTFKKGILTVDPFDTPTPLVDVDPA